MSSESIIEFKNVRKKYSTRDVFHRSIRQDLIKLFQSLDDGGLNEGEFWALRDVNINVRKGECLGIYGPNGAGKTTVLKLIASVTYPNQGTVKVKGKVAPLISIGAGFHPDLTGRENIYMNGTIIGMTIKEVGDQLNDIIIFSEMAPKFIDMPVKKYSSGMSARLGFSIAIHSSADILLIDELFEVGDESFRSKCIDKIKELTKSDKTILIVSHNKKLMEEIVDRIIFIDKGEIEKVLVLKK